MTKKIVSLDGAWSMRNTKNEEWMSAHVPGSVYSNLLLHAKMPDPYYRENQYEVCGLSIDDYEFEKVFEAPGTLLSYDCIFLRFEGLDTLAEITLNGSPLGHADNMHRVWEYEVKHLLKEGGNTLRVLFSSPIKYIQAKQGADPLWGVATTIPGYPHLRKAHYMFGWDWAPQLPDMGIWRPVALVGANYARLDGVYVTQRHGGGTVGLDIRVDIERFGRVVHDERVGRDEGVVCVVRVLHDGRDGRDGRDEGGVRIGRDGRVGHDGRDERVVDENLCVSVSLLAPDGTIAKETAVPGGNSSNVHFDVISPEIWWPNGYGAQPLYEIEACLSFDGRVIDSKRLKIGLRTIEICRENDQWGQEFCFSVNGVKIFAMGADYIPEDQIISRCSPEKTRELLQQCVEANFNHIRVWGGGYYPGDYFYELCDEMGLLVWQDFMFACAVYRMTDTFVGNIRHELIDNIKRIRNHACLAIWCGNNEMETAWDDWGITQDETLKADYRYQFESLFPAICEQYDPNTFYWPSSPSCGGGFDKPNDYTRGDVHYWDVWHGMKPLTEFRGFYFRFCSEYGFMSLPNIKTVLGFTGENDLNLFSAVMEAHQKCDDGMKKLLYYMSQMVQYPYTFKGVIYATQLIQADAIRSNVEHMRRNRGRCMGSTYWQLNDSNPIISWSSIDYNGRWKALHYYAKRFYAPVLLSVNEENIASVAFNISNEKTTAVNGALSWSLRDNASNILASGGCEVTVAPLSAAYCLNLDLSGNVCSVEDRRTKYLQYTFVENGHITSQGSSLFVQPKHFKFIDPKLHVRVSQDESKFYIHLTAEAYVKSLFIDHGQSDCRFSDNWIDIHGNETITVIEILRETITPSLSVEEFEKGLFFQSCNGDDIRSHKK